MKKLTAKERNILRKIAAQKHIYFTCIVIEEEISFAQKRRYKEMFGLGHLTRNETELCLMSEKRLQQVRALMLLTFAEIG